MVNVMRHLPLLLLLSLGCAARHTPGTDKTQGDSARVDSGGDTSSDSPTESEVGELYGTAPAVAKAAPEFNATNRDGSARSREDLIGQPTIIWFFPAAGTYG